MTTSNQAQPPALFPSIARDLTIQVAAAYRRETRLLPSHFRWQLTRMVKRIEAAAQAQPKYSKRQVAEFVLRELSLESQRKAYAEEFAPADQLAVATVLTAANLILAATRPPLADYSAS